MYLDDFTRLFRGHWVTQKKESTLVKKFTQIPLKVNAVYFFDIKHGLTMTF